jgi:hypothetical protein
VEPQQYGFIFCYVIGALICFTVELQPCYIA